MTYFCKHTYIPVYIIKCEIGPLKELWKPNKSYENQYGENMHGSILSFKLCRWNTIPRNFIAPPPKVMIHEHFGAFWPELQEFIFPFLFAQSRHSNVCECPRWAWEVAKDFRLISFSTGMDMYVKRNFFSSRSVQFNLNKKKSTLQNTWGAAILRNVSWNRLCKTKHSRTKSLHPPLTFVDFCFRPKSGALN